MVFFWRFWLCYHLNGSHRKVKHFCGTLSIRFENKFHYYIICRNANVGSSFHSSYAPQYSTVQYGIHWKVFHLMEMWFFAQIQKCVKRRSIYLILHAMHFQFYFSYSNFLPLLWASRCFYCIISTFTIFCSTHPPSFSHSLTAILTFLSVNSI